MFRSSSSWLASGMRTSIVLGFVVAATEAFRPMKFASPLVMPSRAACHGPPALQATAKNARVAHEQGQASASMPGATFTIADQPARFAKAKENNDARVLDIDSVYDPSSLKGKRVLVTGGNRGLGRAIADELVAIGAETIITCRKMTPDLSTAGFAQVVDGIDVTDTASVERLSSAIEAPIDVVINNAGYFYEPLETIDDLNFEEELKMIDICALGPLRVTSVLHKAGLIPSGGKVAMITSQGGSIDWRFTQCPDGHDYGHHMSKAAANMMSVLVANELKAKGIIVMALHPGFNTTDMTAKYKEIWEVEGAVDPSIGAKRTLHEIIIATMDTSGSFINCEDGLQIPW